MVVLGLASFANDLAMPTSWATCMDVGGRYAGTLSGSMNMMGSLTAGLAPIIVGYLLAATGRDWSLTFYLSAAVYLVGAVCWLFIDPARPLADVSSRARCAPTPADAPL
jgi:cyanate permease